jgi:hypothetical protein
VPLQGHWERVNTPLRTTSRREIRAMTAVAAIVIVGLVIGLFAVLGGSSPPAAAGCVDVPAAHSVGGGSYEICGDRAALWCRSESARDDWLASAARDRCARAGYR